MLTNFLSSMTESLYTIGKLKCCFPTSMHLFIEHWEKKHHTIIFCWSLLNIWISTFSFYCWFIIRTLRCICGSWKNALKFFCKVVEKIVDSMEYHKSIIAWELDSVRESLFHICILWVVHFHHFLVIPFKFFHEIHFFFF